MNKKRASWICSILKLETKIILLLFLILFPQFSLFIYRHVTPGEAVSQAKGALTMFTSESSNFSSGVSSAHLGGSADLCCPTRRHPEEEERPQGVQIVVAWSEAQSIVRFRSRLSRLNDAGWTRGQDVENALSGSHWQDVHCFHTPFCVTLIKVSFPMRGPIVITLLVSFEKNRLLQQSNHSLSVSRRLREIRNELSESGSLVSFIH